MKTHSRRGFTLIELLVVIAIIAVLASIAYPVFTGVQERGKVTQDLNNLRQLGLATQVYLNENDGIIFSTDPTDPAADTWMEVLKTKGQLPWKIFQSGFDKRSPSETGATAPVSYGVNGNSILGTPIDKIKNTASFILFAPAQDSSTAVNFMGLASTLAPGVTVHQGSSNPGGTFRGRTPHGTNTRRSRITALFADLHGENIPWTEFINAEKWLPEPSPSPSP